MLEFCETVKPSLEDYESDGVWPRSLDTYRAVLTLLQAWPTLLDDFVAWKKSN